MASLPTLRSAGLGRVEEDAADAVTVAVVVPSHRRPAALEDCLQGLRQQSDRADRVVVVHRDGDAQTARVGQAAGGVDVVAVHAPGVVRAMAAGAARAGTDVVAFCDDDAIPRADWVQRIRGAFADPALGALGGRDVLGPPHPLYPPTREVGIVGRWGRLTGEHHRGAGPVRTVDVLKAVNMAFRSAALAFPDGLRGQGAQVHFELAMCLWAVDRGWRVVYDPELVVDHHPQARFDADRRGRPSRTAVGDAAFNYTWTLLSLRRELALRRLAFGLLVGDTASPGLARAAAAALRGEPETLRRLGPSLAGQLAAVRELRAGRRTVLRPVSRSGPG